MKKADIIALLAVIALSAALFFILPFSRGSGKTVTVSQNNEAVYCGDLSQDKTVELEGNTVVINGGLVYMEKASCKNQICVHHKKISKAGESVVCLPNRVIIEIN